MPVLGTLESPPARNDHACLRQGHTLAARCDRRELHKLELFRGRVGLELHDIRRCGALGERDGPWPHRDYRRHLDAHLGAHLSGIHRPPDLECVARYGERGDVGGVRTAQACRETSAQIAAVEGRAKHHEIGLLRLDLLRKSTHERKRGISVARDLEDRRLAERLRLRGELEAHAPQTAIPTLRDDEDLHRTFASSRSKVASC